MPEPLEQVDSFLDDTVTVHRLRVPYDDHGDLVMTVGEAGLTLSSLFPEIQPDLPDPVLGLHPKIRYDQREAERDPVSTEYILHLDGSCEPIRPTASLVIAREAEEGVLPTRFLSMTGFYALATELGIFQNFDPTEVDAIFGYSAYYSQTQPYWLELKPDSLKLQKVIAKDFAREDVTTREELLQKLDEDPLKGKRRFPLISPHSITGEDTIMIDGGVRSISLATRESGMPTEVDQRDLNEAFKDLRQLMTEADRLKAEGLTVEISPRTGFGVAFPKETLHNQVPPADEAPQTAKRRISVIGLIAEAA